MIKEIGQFLESMSGCDLVIGENLFVGHLPVKTPSGNPPPARCIVVLENAGGMTIPDLPDWVEKAVTWDCGMDVALCRGGPDVRRDGDQCDRPTRAHFESRRERKLHFLD